jgi:hypothetical protein
MNLQSGLKLLLASAVAVCCVSPAIADPVITEFSGDVGSFHGGWTGNGSQLGQPVTFDIVYDSNALVTSMTGTLYILTAPITSADIVGGIFGSGVNLEADGPGKGKITDTIDVNSGAVTLIASTNTHAPNSGFTGDVYGVSVDSDGTNTSVDLTRDVYSHGTLDRKKSGTVDLSNVSISQVQAPEIDPTSALSALTLLMGGLAVLRGRITVRSRATARAS